MKQLIAFDMDGTLIDSLGLTIQVLARTIEHFTGIRPTKEQVVQHFGVSEEKIFAAVFGIEKAAEMNNKYNEYFQEEVHKTTLFDGIKEMLSALSQKPHLSLALYTARGRGTTDILLKHHELESLFQFILTGSEVTLGKPHPEGLLILKDALKFDKEIMFYIGDSHKDIEMAHAVSAIPIGVQWCPMVNKQTLSASAPKHMFSHPSELNEFLGAL